MLASRIRAGTQEIIRLHIQPKEIFPDMMIFQVNINDAVIFSNRQDFFLMIQNERVNKLLRRSYTMAAGNFLREPSLCVTGFSAETAGLSVIKGRASKNELSWFCCHTT